MSVEVALSLVTVVLAAAYFLYRKRLASDPRDRHSAAADDPRNWVMQAYFQEAPVPYQVSDLHGTIVRVNRRECELRGLDASQMLGKFMWDLYPEDQRELIRTQVERRLRAAKPPSGALHRKFVRPDGQVVFLEIHDRVLRGEDGEVLGLLSAAIEVAQESTAPVMASKLLSRLPDTVLRLDSDGYVLEGVQGSDPVFFSSPEEITGKPLQGAVPVDEGLRLVQSLSRMRTIRETITCELTAPVAGKEEIFEIRLCPADDGEAVAIIRKITERKEADRKLEQLGRDLRQQNIELERALEDAREATLIKSRFLASMSHAIRTPMNGILGMIEFLMSTHLSEDQLDYARSMRQSAGSLLTLINDMLDVSKIEAGRMKLERIPFDLTMTVEEITAASAARARAKGLEFVCSMSPDLPNELVGDPGRLRQILNNLIDNAIKFTPNGRVSVRTEKVEEAGNRITVGFLVQDSGMGISEERQIRLFDGGAEAETSDARKHTGAGLGLILSRQLVEMMGGEIGVRSVEGRGSTFYFTAVFEKAPEKGAAEVPATQNGGEDSLDGVGVVFLAPKTSVTWPVTRMLQSWNCPYLHAASIEELTGELAETGIPRQSLRIALIDIDIPGLDVTEIAAALKYDLRLKEIQMIAVTSVPLRGDGDRLRQLGYVGYLNKPLSGNVLRGIMLEALHSKERAGAAVGPIPLITRHSINQARRWETPHGLPRILLVEDNPISQRVALKLLQKIGLPADAVSSGKEALDALEHEAYDLVLLDCQMPGMDGFAVTAEIRRREAGRRHTPICAVTSNALAGDRERCLAAGMDDYVSKPISLPELQAALERLLREQLEPVVTQSSY